MIINGTEYIKADDFNFVKYREENKKLKELLYAMTSKEFVNNYLYASEKHRTVQYAIKHLDETNKPEILKLKEEIKSLNLKIGAIKANEKRAKHAGGTYTLTKGELTKLKNIKELLNGIDI